MSDPGSRDKKIAGRDLYAPRRARTPSASDEQPTTPTTPPVEKNEEPSASDGDVGWTDAQAADVQARLDDAIREAIKMARTPDSAPSPAPPIGSAAPAMSPRESINWPPPSIDLWRHDDSLTHAAAPLSYSRLDPELVPNPPVAIRVQRRGIFPMLARLSLVVVAAAIVAYGFTEIFSVRPDRSLPQRATESVASNAPVSPAFHEPASEPALPSRLVVTNQQAFVNEPLALAVSVEPSSGHESLVFAGLAAGTRLSAGVPVSDTSWQVPSNELPGLSLYAPRDFVGVMNTAIDLLSPDKRLLDTRAVALEWIVKKPAPPAQPAAPIASANPSTPAVQPIDSDRAAALLQRGRELLKTGDIAAARVAFLPLADAGNAEAALALGASFDPRYLARQNVIGVAGDEAKARAWYQRAMELGSTEAKNILARMETK
ncbi:MAG TPA: hypothetical protein VGJ20_25110 [Xanthobacteraceae bacterium]|jgi:hypothetical protein